MQLSMGSFTPLPLSRCAAGVHEAIQLKYLKALHFGFSSDACGENLLEEYVYHFAYDGNKVQLNANGTNVALSQSTKVSTHSDTACMHTRCIRERLLNADRMCCARFRTTSRP